ncbi:hypothetical protein NL676_004341 [Syzygium grande]|nr:hypothetical protein NL676_004341 [Syzygium grande]
MSPCPILVGATGVSMLFLAGGQCGPRCLLVSVVSPRHGLAQAADPHITVQALIRPHKTLYVSTSMNTALQCFSLVLLPKSEARLEPGHT